MTAPDPLLERVRVAVAQRVRDALVRGDEERADWWRSCLEEVEAAYVPPAERQPGL